MKFKWECPKCGAVSGHGKGTCQSEGYACSGLICNCMTDIAENHGETLSDPCPDANCSHCGWVGTLPKKPKGLRAWEQKALTAGWLMPAQRKEELGLTAEETP